MNAKAKKGEKVFGGDDLKRATICLKSDTLDYIDKMAEETVRSRSQMIEVMVGEYKLKNSSKK